MVAWAPILSALPLVIEVIKQAKPVFTSSKDSKSDTEVITTQITELQSAVTQNAESLIELATQLKTTIEGIESGASNIQNSIKNQKRLIVLSFVVSLISLGVALWAILSN